MCACAWGDEREGGREGERRRERRHKRICAGEKEDMRKGKERGQRMEREGERAREL